MNFLQFSIFLILTITYEVQSHYGGGATAGGHSGGGGGGGGGGATIVGPSDPGVTIQGPGSQTKVIGPDGSHIIAKEIGGTIIAPPKQGKKSKFFKLTAQHDICTPGGIIQHSESPGYISTGGSSAGSTNTYGGYPGYGGYSNGAGVGGIHPPVSVHNGGTGNSGFGGHTSGSSGCGGCGRSDCGCINGIPYSGHSGGNNGQITPGYPGGHQPYPGTYQGHQGYPSGHHQSYSSNTGSDGQVHPGGRGSGIEGQVAAGGRGSGIEGQWQPDYREKQFDDGLYKGEGARYQQGGGSGDYSSLSGNYASATATASAGAYTNHRGGNCCNGKK